MEDKKQPIVIKKIIAGHGHHGGSWKVAFADFAVAMMAFFMVLWLVGQTDAEQRGGIAEYFQNPSMVRGHSQAPTGSIGPGGAGMSLISFGTSVEMSKEDPTIIEKVRDGGMAYVSYEKVIEQRRLESLMDELREEIGKSQALKPFKDQLLLEIMPNGLRIQIIDKENRPMFDSGSANLKHYSEAILHELAKTINRVSNKVTISGHTDASPMSKRRGGYTNWELSSDRANAARRALIAGGLNAERIGRVIGLASTILFDKERPRSAINRRISIVVMKREVSDLAKLDDEMKAVPTELLQDSRGLDNIKDNSPSPLSDDSLEAQDAMRLNKIDGIKKIDQHSSTLDMKFDDLREGGKTDSHQNKKPELEVNRHNNKDNEKKGKKTKSSRKPSSELDPAQHDRQITVRDTRDAKSFIKLPPIIAPNLIPGIRKENK